MQYARSQKGFTLVEILIVIGILAVLTGIVLIALNPARQFGQANNQKRRSDVDQILNAVNQYTIDNKGTAPAAIPTSSAADIGNTAGLVDLCALLVPQYIAALPQDPSINAGANISNCASSHDTGYTIIIDATSKRVTVAAPLAVNGTVINATR